MTTRCRDRTEGRNDRRTAGRGHDVGTGRPGPDGTGRTRSRTDGVPIRLVRSHRSTGRLGVLRRRDPVSDEEPDRERRTPQHVVEPGGHRSTLLGGRSEHGDHRCRRQRPGPLRGPGVSSSTATPPHPSAATDSACGWSTGASGRRVAQSTTQQKKRQRRDASSSEARRRCRLTTGCASRDRCRLTEQSAT